MSIDLISTPEPHFIPGYTGYCPQYIYRIGDTYGQLTHKLLIDPSVPRTEKLIISNRNLDEYEVHRPTLREIDLVKAHEEDGDPVYKHPTIPGYEGFLPYVTDKIGRRFSITASEGIAEFEKHMQKLRRDARKLKHRVAVQDGSVKIRSIGDRLLQTNDYKLPLAAVRPECVGILNEIPENDLPTAPPLPYSKHSPPHFMSANNPEKYIKAGYGGHIPFSWHRFAKSNKDLTNKALTDFIMNYKHRRSIEWSPVTDVGHKILNSNRPSFEIYPKNTGLIPNYAGHVPGASVRFGKTFGKDSIDAKRWFYEE